MKRFKGDCVLFSIGGAGYALIEILWRRKTHWTMALTGGTAFVALFRFYKKFDGMRMLRKCVSGSLIITSMEFLCGCIVNLKYKLGVWDYSNCRFNVKGQICPFYSALWALLCIPVSKLCSAIQSKTSI